MAKRRTAERRWFLHADGRLQGETGMTMEEAVAEVMALDEASLLEVSEEARAEAKAGAKAELAPVIEELIEAGLIEWVPDADKPTLRLTELGRKWADRSSRS